MENSLLARTYARPTAILHFLLSQPSHSLRSSALISPWYQGIILLKFPTFFEKTPTFFEKSPTFSQISPRVVDNTPIFPFSPPHPHFLPVVPIPLFSSHFPWFSALLPHFSKWMLINWLHLFVSQCITAKTVKVVKAKTTICWVRACTHARETLILHLLGWTKKLVGATFVVLVYLARIYKKLLRTFKIEVCRVYPHFSWIETQQH